MGTYVEDHRWHVKQVTHTVACEMLADVDFVLMRESLYCEADLVEFDAWIADTYCCVQGLLSKGYYIFNLRRGRLLESSVDDS